jgi:nuclear RNA export factor
MIVCDAILETQEAKEQAIQSVTLSANNLENTHAVYQLCNHFRHIQNLDLSNNAFATLDALKPWKGRFKNVEHR